MVDRKPALTVVITVYNDGEYLRETLNSLLNQTLKDFIIFISDDCSTDNSYEICNEYAQKYERIEYVRHKKNMGSLSHFYYVINRVDTPFLIFSSGHDKYHPQFVEKLLPVIQGDQNLILVYPRTQVINFDRSLGKIHEDNYTTEDLDSPTQRYLYMLKNMKVCAMFQGIWKTEIMKNINPKPIISNDRLMVLKASFRGKFKQYPEILFFMRQNRKPDRGNKMYQREIRMITGKYPKMSKPSFLLKWEFILENLKTIFKENSLSLFSKINIAIQSTYFWIRKFWMLQPYIGIKDFFSGIKIIKHE